MRHGVVIFIYDPVPFMALPQLLHHWNEPFRIIKPGNRDRLLRLVTADVSLVETAAAAVFAGADALIVTGSATGQVTDPGELEDVRAAVDVPVVVGSGVTEDNLDRYLAADALVIGSHFKDAGHWTGPVSPDRVASFLDKLHDLRRSS